MNKAQKTTALCWIDAAMTERLPNLTTVNLFRSSQWQARSNACRFVCLLTAMKIVRLGAARSRVVRRVATAARRRGRRAARLGQFDSVVATKHGASLGSHHFHLHVDETLDETKPRERF